MSSIGKLFTDGNEMHETNQSLETPKASADPLSADGEAFSPAGSTKLEPLNKGGEFNMHAKGENSGDNP